jgi:hypothetical protein
MAITIRIPTLNGHPGLEGECTFNPPPVRCVPMNRARPR